MLGRLAIFLAIIGLCFSPYLAADIEDNNKIRLFLIVFIPCTVLTIVLFGFCDQIFFKMKLYDLDVHNMEADIITLNEDPFAVLKSSGRINMSES